MIDEKHEYIERGVSGMAAIIAFSGKESVTVNVCIICQRGAWEMIGT